MRRERGSCGFFFFSCPPCKRGPAPLWFVQAFKWRSLRQALIEDALQRRLEERQAASREAPGGGDSAGAPQAGVAPPEPPGQRPRRGWADCLRWRRAARSAAAQTQLTREEIAELVGQYPNIYNRGFWANLGEVIWPRSQRPDAMAAAAAAAAAEAAAEAAAGAASPAGTAVAATAQPVAASKRHRANKTFT